MREGRVRYRHPEERAERLPSLLHVEHEQAIGGHRRDHLGVVAQELRDVRFPIDATLHLAIADQDVDDVFCGAFGTTGRCLDTVSSTGAANDDLDVVFTGGGVLAFGFALNALDIAWTITTYGVGDVLLGTYVVDSQSPGLTGNARRGYFGATEGVAIQSFRIRSTGSDRALIDDFAYVPAPEPGAAMLVGLGLAWLAAARSPGAGRADRV